MSDYVDYYVDWISIWIDLEIKVEMDYLFDLAFFHDDISKVMNKLMEIAKW